MLSDQQRAAAAARASGQDGSVPQPVQAEMELHVAAALGAGRVGDAEVRGGVQPGSKS